MERVVFDHLNSLYQTALNMNYDCNKMVNIGIKELPNITLSNSLLYYIVLIFIT